MTTVRTDSDRDELIRRLNKLSVGDVRVESVEVKDDYWPGDRPTQIVVHLSDPTGETWDDDDMSQLTGKVYSVLAEFDALSTSRTTFTGGPAIEDEPAPDEDGAGQE